MQIQAQTNEDETRRSTEEFITRTLIDFATERDGIRARLAAMDDIMQNMLSAWMR
jgi:hypothetical protein